MSVVPIVLTSTPSNLMDASSISVSKTMLYPPSSPRGLTRTLSEGELSNYSSVTSMRDAIASARRTRETIRKSRKNIRALRLDSQRTLREAHKLRREMHSVLISRRKIKLTVPSPDESDQESDSGKISQPTVATEVSDLTLDTSPSMD